MKNFFLLLGLILISFLGLYFLLATYISFQKENISAENERFAINVEIKKNKSLLDAEIADLNESKTSTKMCRAYILYELENYRNTMLGNDESSLPELVYCYSGLGCSTDLKRSFDLKMKYLDMFQNACTDDVLEASSKI